MEGEVLREHIRKRPAMYIGNERTTVPIIRMLLLECISLGGGAAIRIMVRVLPEGKFTFVVSPSIGKDNLFTEDPAGRFPWIFGGSVLLAITSHLQVEDNDNELRIDFSIDEKYGFQSSADFDVLSARLRELALVYTEATIVIEDLQMEEMRRSYFQYPDGMLHLLDQIVDSGRDSFVRIGCREKAGLNEYVIGLRLYDRRQDPWIRTYAEDGEAADDGSLVDGILDGVRSAFYQYAIQSGWVKISLRRRNMKEYVKIAASVRGGEYRYGGSIRRGLEDPAVARECKKIVHGAVFLYLEGHPERALELYKAFVG